MATAMEKMLADMLQKALGPEVATMLAPDNLKRIGDEFGELLLFFKQKLETIEAQNAVILSHLQQQHGSWGERLLLGEGFISEDEKQPLEILLMETEANGGEDNRNDSNRDSDATGESGGNSGTSINGSYYRN